MGHEDGQTDGMRVSVDGTCRVPGLLRESQPPSE